MNLMKSLRKSGIYRKPLFETRVMQVHSKALAHSKTLVHSSSLAKVNTIFHCEKNKILSIYIPHPISAYSYTHTLTSLSWQQAKHHIGDQVVGDLAETNRC